MLWLAPRWPSLGWAGSGSRSDGRGGGRREGIREGIKIPVLSRDKTTRPLFGLET